METLETVGVLTALESAARPKRDEQVAPMPRSEQRRQGEWMIPCGSREMVGRGRVHLMWPPGPYRALASSQWVHRSTIAWLYGGQHPGNGIKALAWDSVAGGDTGAHVTTHPSSSQISYPALGCTGGDVSFNTNACKAVSMSLPSIVCDGYGYWSLQQRRRFSHVLTT